MQFGTTSIWKTYWREMILSLLVAVIVGPALYYQVPILVSSPDILYVKAKIMWVARGSIFADPITGYDTMHPSWFHVILAPLYATGIGRDTILSFVTLFNVALLFFFTYKIIAHVYDRRIAFWTCVMIPFAVEYMGPRNILLATSFYFSIPFYLAGLWLFLRSESSVKGTVGAAILWGLAFLISPVYLFLMGLTLLYEALVKRRLRRFAIIAGIFLVMLTPFYIQLYTVYSQGLGEAGTFSLWRGIPGSNWLQYLVIEFLSPSVHRVTDAGAIANILLLLAAIMVFLWRKSVNWFIPVAFLAFLLTFYHFSGQYAIRIQLFFSIFVIGTVIAALTRNRRYAFLWVIPLIGMTAFALYHHYSGIGDIYKNERPVHYERLEVSRILRQNMDDYLQPDAYIFCNNNTYLRYVMPYYPVHCLGAYRTMEYFQLPDSIADMLHRDDILTERNSDYTVIDSIARKYGITVAVLTPVEVGVPLYETLARQWDVVYQDGYFGILKKPE